VANQEDVPLKQKMREIEKLYAQVGQVWVGGRAGRKFLGRIEKLYAQVRGRKRDAGEGVGVGLGVGWRERR